jgi:uncharacterized membrane protein YeaQ/YmgE (transglycosylase-associated protein family)
MNFVALLTVAVLVGWIATLILHDEVSLSDFAIAIAGAALAGGLLAPRLGISPTGEHGLSLSGTLLCWGGAMTLPAISNLLRCGRLRRTSERGRYLSLVSLKAPGARLLVASFQEGTHENKNN